MLSAIREFRNGVSPARAFTTCAIALFLNASSLHAQTTRSLNAAATTVSDASVFFPPRVERDSARGRIWTLNEGTLLLYDGRTRTFVKKIGLAGNVKKQNGFEKHTITGIWEKSTSVFIIY